MALRETVERELAALNRHDVDAVVSFYAEDVIFEDASLDEPIRGRAALHAYVGGFISAFPDLRLDTRTMFGDERLLALEFDMSGTHLGELDGHAPTERRFKVRACSVYQFDGSHLAREAFYWDSASVMRQLGLS